ncbi:YktB family protein [Gracilibacillus sp. D59]|uniref:YktB family protein n=1 Tax=Gracilibacillus sp. D59 TaxID=3457434 RepID=UPI003FCE7689
MTFNGFQQKDFETFQIDGLDERMEAIQERIQPKFRSIYEEIAADLNVLAGREMYLHIAKHARRTVNPPNDTWSAYCHNKRGYKKHPHFQVGLWDDNLFIWLAFIYELPHKSEIAAKFISEINDIKETVPENYHISLDHMKNEATPLSQIDLEKGLERFKKVKKAEFLIGRRFDAKDPLLWDGDKLIQTIKETFQTLAPLYRSSMDL